MNVYRMQPQGIDPMLRTGFFISKIPDFFKQAELERLDQ
jgi:hypothetical protein